MMRKIMRFCLNEMTAWQKAVYAVCTVLYSTIYLITIYRTHYTSRVVDEIFEAGNYDMSLLLRLLGVILGLQILRSVVRYVCRMEHNKISQDMRQKQREHLYDMIQAQDTSFFKAYSTGDLISRVTSDLDWCRHLICWMIPCLFDEVISLIASFLYLSAINVPLTVILAVLSPIAIFFSRRMMKFIQPMHKAISEENAVLNKQVQENLSGNRVVKAYAKEAYEIEKFEAKNKKLREMEIRTGVKALKYSVPIDFLSALMAAVALVGGGFFAMKGAITVGQMTAFLSLATSMASPIKSINNLANQWAKVKTSTERVLEIYEREPKIFSPENAYKPERFKGRVEFDHVTFSRNGMKILDDVSFVIPEGQTVAMMGPTGAGKTCIINLILRLNDVDSGRVLVDGVDVREYDLATLRHFIGVSTQDVFLFSETIEGNISYGNPDMSMEDVYTAAERAQASRFIRHTSDGYDTIIGERGVGLSGGQKQRLALARALAIEAPILILDDTTSALDMETEAEIQKCLKEYYRETTQIIIAQRISSVKDAERILILENGKITEEGTHEELIKIPGYYKTIHDLQNGGDVDAQ